MKIKTDAIETRVDNRFEAIDVGGPFDQTIGPVTGVLAAGLRLRASCRKAHRGLRACHPGGLRRPGLLPLGDSRGSPGVPRIPGLRAQARRWAEEGIATALEAVLVSPKFLYRIEKTRRRRRTNRRPRNPLELASRLSYFLWSNMPDADLLRAAGQRTLRQPAVLNAQVPRMLRIRSRPRWWRTSPGSGSNSRTSTSSVPTSSASRIFDDGLRQAMRRETELFIQSIIRDDRSVLDLLDADYTFVNERLARFYGIPGLAGQQYSRR